MIMNLIHDAIEVDRIAQTSMLITILCSRFGGCKVTGHQRRMTPSRFHPKN